VARLAEYGLDSTVGSGPFLDCAVIDRRVSWYGSIKYLGFNTEEDNAMRMENPSIASDLIDAVLG